MHKVLKVATLVAMGVAVTACNKKAADDGAAADAANAVATNEATPAEVVANDPSADAMDMNNATDNATENATENATDQGSTDH